VFEFSHGALSARSILTTPDLSFSTRSRAISFSSRHTTCRGSHERKRRRREKWEEKPTREKYVCHRNDWFVAAFSFVEGKTLRKLLSRWSYLEKNRSSDCLRSPDLIINDNSKKHSRSMIFNLEETCYKRPLESLEIIFRKILIYKHHPRKRERTHVCQSWICRDNLRVWLARGVFGIETMVASASTISRRVISFRFASFESLRRKKRFGPGAKTVMCRLNVNRRQSPISIARWPRLRLLICVCQRNHKVYVHDDWRARNPRESRTKAARGIRGRETRAEYPFVGSR